MPNTLSKGVRKRLCKLTASQACAPRHPPPSALDFPRTKRTRHSSTLTRSREALRSKSMANARTKLAGQRNNKRSKITHAAHDAACHRDHGSDRCLMPEYPDGDSTSELGDLTPAIYGEETGAVTEPGHTKASRLGKFGAQSLGSLRRSSRLAPANPYTTPSAAESATVEPMGSPLLRPTDAILVVPIVSAMSSDNGEAGESDSSAYCTAQEEIVQFESKTQPQNTISQPRTEVPNNPSTSANESDRCMGRKGNAIPADVRAWTVEEEAACSEIMKELMRRGRWRLGLKVCYEEACVLMASRGFDRTSKAIRNRWERFLSFLPQNLPQPEATE